jgi:hypothetical protein
MPRTPSRSTVYVVCGSLHPRIPRCYCLLNRKHAGEHRSGEKRWPASSKPSPSRSPHATDMRTSNPRSKTPSMIDPARIVAALKRRRGQLRNASHREPSGFSKIQLWSMKNGIEEAIAIIERLARGKK